MDNCLSAFKANLLAQQPAPYIQEKQENAAAAFTETMKSYDANAPEPHDEGCLYYHSWDSDLMKTAQRYVAQAREAGTYNFERGMFLLKTLFDIILPGKTKQNLEHSTDEIVAWSKKENLAFTIAKTYEHEIARRSQEDFSSDELESMREEAEKYRAFVPERNLFAQCERVHREIALEAISLFLEFSDGPELSLSPSSPEMALDCLLIAIAKDWQVSNQFLMEQKQRLVNSRGCIITSPIAFVIHNVTPTNAMPIYECIGVGGITEIFMATIQLSSSQDQKDRLLHNLFDILRAIAHPSY